MTPRKSWFVESIGFWVWALLSIVLLTLFLVTLQFWMKTGRFGSISKFTELVLSHWNLVWVLIDHIDHWICLFICSKYSSHALWVLLTTMEQIHWLGLAVLVSADLHLILCKALCGLSLWNVSWTFMLTPCCLHLARVCKTIERLSRFLFSLRAFLVFVKRARCSLTSCSSIKFDLTHPECVFCCLFGAPLRRFSNCKWIKSTSNHHHL